MTREVYTIGYSGRQLADIARIARELDATIFDIRYVARSRNPEFSSQNMADALGDRYAHVRALGNINYKGEFQDTVILDIEAGIDRIEHHSRPVILMCTCKDYYTCHRRVLSEELVRRGYQVQEIPLHALPAPSEPTAPSAPSAPHAPTAPPVLHAIQDRLF